MSMSNSILQTLVIVLFRSPLNSLVKKLICFSLFLQFRVVWKNFQLFIKKLGLLNKKKLSIILCLLYQILLTIAFLPHFDCNFVSIRRKEKSIDFGKGSSETDTQLFHFPPGAQSHKKLHVRKWTISTIE